MATEAGELIIKIGADVEELKSALTQMSNKLSQTATESTAKGLIIGATFIETGKAIIRFGKDSVLAFGQQELAVTRLAGVVGKDVASAFEQYAVELQKTTIYSDDSIIALQSQLANFGLYPGSIKEATVALIDFASRTGKDLPEAANIFGQALAGNSRELKRYGLTILESDDRTTKMNKTIEFMEQKFHGAASEIKNTTLGQIENFKNRIEDLQEKIGKELVPVMQTWSVWIEKAVGALEKMTGASKNDLSVRELTIKKLEDEKNAVSLSLQGYSEYRNSLVQIYGVQANNDQFLRDRLKSTTDQIKLLKQQETQEKKTADTTRKGLQQVKSDVEQAFEAKVSALKKELILDEYTMRHEADLSTMATQKRILDSKLELAQLQADQVQITVITDVETQKRLLQSQMSYEANASYSDQLKLKMADNMANNTSDWVNLTTTMMDSFAQSTAKMIVEGGRFSEVIKNLWKQLAEAVIAQIIRMIAQWLVWMALTGGSGGAFGGLAGGMAGGGMINEPSVIVGLKSGKRHLAGESGPEMVVPTNGGGGGNKAFSGAGVSAGGGSGGGGGDVHIHISGQFIEGSPTKWQRLIQEQIAPGVRRLAMKDPNSLITRKRGSLS